MPPKVRALPDESPSRDETQRRSNGTTAVLPPAIAVAPNGDLASAKPSSRETQAQITSFFRSIPTEGSCNAVEDEISGTGEKPSDRSLPSGFRVDTISPVRSLPNEEIWVAALVAASQGHKLATTVEFWQEHYPQKLRSRRQSNKALQRLYQRHIAGKRSETVQEALGWIAGRNHILLKLPTTVQAFVQAAFERHRTETGSDSSILSQDMKKSNSGASKPTLPVNNAAGKRKLAEDSESDSDSSIDLRISSPKPKVSASQRNTCPSPSYSLTSPGYSPPEGKSASSRKPNAGFLAGASLCESNVSQVDGSLTPVSAPGVADKAAIDALLKPSGLAAVPSTSAPEPDLKAELLRSMTNQEHVDGKRKLLAQVVEGERPAPPEFSAHKTKLNKQSLAAKEFHGDSFQAVVDKMTEAINQANVAVEKKFYEVHDRYLELTLTRIEQRVKEQTEQLVNDGLVRPDGLAAFLKETREQAQANAQQMLSRVPKQKQGPLLAPPASSNGGQPGRRRRFRPRRGGNGGSGPHARGGR